MKTGRLVVMMATALLAGAQGDLEKRLNDVAGIKPDELRTFLAQLQNGGKTAISKMVQYPLTVKTAGKTVRVKNAPDFVTKYDSLFTPKVRQALAKQQFDKLFVNAKGAMIGDGELWISAVCQDKACKQSQLRVIGINP